MKLLTYNDMKIEVMQKPDNPNKLVKMACDTTMMREVVAQEHFEAKHLIRFLIKAEHTSVLEHAVYTFYISNVSRAFLAQITRHRMCSFTVASQHYQDYRDYPMVVHPAHKDDFSEPAYLNADKDAGAAVSALEIALEDYTIMIDDCGVPAYEARQVLPNAAAVNIIWTINARSMLNFFRQRCCNRNTDEMQLFANRLFHLMLNLWFDFAINAGPACHTGFCNQKRMQCAQGQWNPYTRL